MLYQSCWNNLVTGLIVPSSLLKFVNSLFQTCSNKFGTSSANTSCEQLVNRLVTTCLQVCSNLCVFTCVPERPRVRQMYLAIVQVSKLNPAIVRVIKVNPCPCAGTLSQPCWNIESVLLEKLSQLCWNIEPV